MQDWVGRLPGVVPAQARAALVRVLRSLRRMDRSLLMISGLGVGLAVMGALYSAASIRNKHLYKALMAKDRDMDTLVMKVRVCLQCGSWLLSEGLAGEVHLQSMVPI